MTSEFGFDIIARDTKSKARVGKLKTPHGVIQTPNFIFCGTKAAIKAMNPFEMKEEGTQIILSNTYHLMIQPGADLVEKMGGLHQFMKWDGPMLTDSGGFQIFSMGHGSIADEIKGRGHVNRRKTLLKITREGAKFRNYLSGEMIFLTPEKSIQIQRQLGADLIVQFDECTPYHVEKRYTYKSMQLSHHWGERSLEEFHRGDTKKQQLYGIIQGGVYPEFREESALYTKERPFFGTAIGGSLGANKEQMYEVVSHTMKMVHPDRPVHLLGIGGIEDVFHGVRQGIDTFDCVSPTRIARHGWALAPKVPKNRINLRNAQCKDDPAPILEGCGCFTCKTFSRSYLHHLLKAGELLALQLITRHNVHIMNRLMSEIREAIVADRLDECQKSWL